MDFLTARRRLTVWLNNEDFAMVDDLAIREYRTMKDLVGSLVHEALVTRGLLQPDSQQEGC